MLSTLLTNEVDVGSIDVDKLRHHSLPVTVNAALECFVRSKGSCHTCIHEHQILLCMIE